MEGGLCPAVDPDRGQGPAPGEVAEQRQRSGCSGITHRPSLTAEETARRPGREVVTEDPLGA